MLVRAAEVVGSDERRNGDNEGEENKRFDKDHCGSRSNECQWIKEGGKTLY
jgi:hypothetical protein